MSRKARWFEPGAVYHLISRFVASEWFIEGDLEREAYLGLFGRAIGESDWRSLAYAAMSNHIHHVVVAGESSLASWLRWPHMKFAEWMNERRGRIGAIFVRGPTEVLVRPEGVASVIAYAHNNPVRAGIVAEAGDSRWTSHAAYLGTARPPAWLDVREGLARAGFATAAGFDAFVGAAPALCASRRPPRLRMRRARPRPQLVMPLADNAAAQSALPA